MDSNNSVVESVNGNDKSALSRLVDMVVSRAKKSMGTRMLVQDAAFIAYTFMLVRYIPVAQDRGLMRGMLCGVLAQFKVNYLAQLQSQSYLIPEERGEIDRTYVERGMKRADISRVRGVTRTIRAEFGNESRWRIVDLIARRFSEFVVGEVTRRINNGESESSVRSAMVNMTSLLRMWQ